MNNIYPLFRHGVNKLDYLLISLFPLGLNITIIQKYLNQLGFHFRHINNFYVLFPNNKG